MRQTNYETEDCIIECESCSLFLIIENTEYEMIDRKLREIGWIVKIDGYDWTDFCCESCYNKYIMEQNTLNERNING